MYVCDVCILVIIKIPPQNATATRGSVVNISCGFQWHRGLPVTWIINGTSFNQLAVNDSLLYQLNNPLRPAKTSLTVFSINGTTTFQCVVLSTPNTTNSLGTITVTGKCICTYTRDGVTNIR